MNTKRFAALFSVILALFVVLSLSVFADGEDTGADEPILLTATSDDSDAASDDAADEPAADDGETKDLSGEETPESGVLTVGASDDTGAADGVTEAIDDGTTAAEDDGTAAPVVDVAGTDDAVTEAVPETGTWSNLGTSGIIGIIVAVVICIAIIVTIVVLIPKKNGQKK